MWKLYDELIENIDENILVKDYYVGSSWTMVRTDENIGISMTVKGNSRPKIMSGNVIGSRLKDIAALSKSWNFIEASIGTAAVNAYYNSFERIEALGGFEGIEFECDDLKSRKKKDAFIDYCSRVAGKKVTIIGHFPNLEEQFAPISDMSILEKNPSKGDYPDSACEFILPEQDFVFITGMTLTNKTLPRLLQIVRDNCEVVLVGPSVPMSEILFKHNVNGLSGFCAADPDKALNILKSGER